MPAGAMRHGNGWQLFPHVFRFYASLHRKSILPWDLDRVVSMAVRI